MTYREREAQQMAGRSAKTCYAPAENTTIDQFQSFRPPDQAREVQVGLQ